MSRTHYEMLNAALHLEKEPAEANENNNNNDNNNYVNETLERVQRLINNITTNFKNVYSPAKNICIDESMVAFKGNTKLKFYLPKKPIKWGLKIHCLCESITGYCWNLQLDTGKLDQKQNNYVENIIMNLVSGLENKGHILHLDSWYSSPSVSMKLHEKGIYMNGIVSENKKNLPQKEDYFNLQKTCATTGKFNLISWKDKKVINIISSVCDKSLIEVNQRSRVIEKPNAFNEYSHNNSGVDRMNQSISYYNRNTRSRKWWKKVFYFLLESSINNANIVYNKINSSEISNLDFRKDLLDEIFGKYVKKDSENTISLDGKIQINKEADKLKIDHPCSHKKCVNIVAIHYIEKNSSRGDCELCKINNKPRSRIKYSCNVCRKHFCIRCFKEFHEKFIYI